MTDTTTEPLFVLAGRVFRRAGTMTARRDNYVTRAALDAGLVGQSLASAENAEAVVRRAMADDAMARAFAGVLAEDGVKWTPAWADTVAELVLDSEDPTVRQAYEARAVEMVLDFFVGAGTWRAISQSASHSPSAMTLPVPAPASSALPALHDLLPDSAESPSTTSASGTTSLELSPNTTPTATG